MLTGTLKLLEEVGVKGGGAWGGWGDNDQGDQTHPLVVQHHVRQPQVVTGDPQLGDVVEVWRVPLQELVRPFLATERHIMLDGYFLP